MLPVRLSSSFTRPTRGEQTGVAQQFVKIRLTARGPIAEQSQQRCHIPAGAVGPQVLNVMREGKVLYNIRA
ncbi:hypothetical protein SBA6_730031 [Candidatus Sulfopaludibacter sp. SbA6]|nr:hypothetical protein SBA6_730031 [Candidatus Sulfopaludibacter sp. SbA6]